MRLGGSFHFDVQQSVRYLSSPELLAENFDRIYLEAGIDAEALIQQLPEKFDAQNRLVPIVYAPAEEGSYLLK